MSDSGPDADLDARDSDDDADSSDAPTYESDVPEWTLQECAGYTCCDDLYEISESWGQPDFADVFAEPVGRDTVPDEEYFTWAGVVDLPTSVTQECPSQYTAGETPSCSVDYAVRLNGASSSKVQLAVGMERSALESVPEGTEVTVDAGDDYLGIFERSSGELLLAVSNYADEFDASPGLKEMVGEIGSFNHQFASADTVENPAQDTGTTACLTEKNGDCDFYWAVQSLVLGRDSQSEPIEPLSAAEVEFDGASWFVQFHGRANTVGWGQMCAREFGGVLKFAALRDISE